MVACQIAHLAMQKHFHRAVATGATSNRGQTALSSVLWETTHHVTSSSEKAKQAVVRVGPPGKLVDVVHELPGHNTPEFRHQGGQKRQRVDPVGFLVQPRVAQTLLGPAVDDVLVESVLVAVPVLAHEELLHDVETVVREHVKHGANVVESDLVAVVHEQSCLVQVVDDVGGPLRVANIVHRDLVVPFLARQQVSVYMSRRCSRAHMSKCRGRRILDRR